MWMVLVRSQRLINLSQFSSRKINSQCILIFKVLCVVCGSRLIRPCLLCSNCEPKFHCPLPQRFCHLSCAKSSEYLPLLQQRSRIAGPLGHERPRSCSRSVCGGGGGNSLRIRATGSRRAQAKLPRHSRLSKPREPQGADLQLLRGAFRL